MSDISSIASTAIAMRQSQYLDQICMSMLKMNAQAEAAMADMLMENARQVQVMSSSSSDNAIDIYV